VDRTAEAYFAGIADSRRLQSGRHAYPSLVLPPNRSCSQQCGAKRIFTSTLPGRGTAKRKGATVSKAPGISNGASRLFGRGWTSAGLICEERSATPARATSARRALYLEPGESLLQHAEWEAKCAGAK
jgi:hypothetical protein